MPNAAAEHHQINDPSVDHLTVMALDEPSASGARNKYVIFSSRQEPASIDIDQTPGSQMVLANYEPLCAIEFQNGPPTANGVNGVTIESLLAVCMHRLEGFQEGPFPSPDNAEALEHLAKAMECLHRRTRSRLERGVKDILTP